MPILIAVLGALALGVLLRYTIYKPIIERRRRMRALTQHAKDATRAQERLAAVLEVAASRVREFGVQVTEEDEGYDELFVGSLDFPRDAPPVMAEERNGDAP